MTTKEKLRHYLEEPEVRTWRSIMGAFQKVYRELEHELWVKQGCSISRFQILFLLYFKGPMASVQLAEQMVVSRGNISTFLKRLEKDELIDYVAGDTEKRWKVDLTQKGVKLFERIFPSHIDSVKEKVKPLSASALKKLDEMYTGECGNPSSKEKGAKK